MNSFQETSCIIKALLSIAHQNASYISLVAIFNQDNFATHADGFRGGRGMLGLALVYFQLTTNLLMANMPILFTQRLEIDLGKLITLTLFQMEIIVMEIILIFIECWKRGKTMFQFLKKCGKGCWNGKFIILYVFLSGEN